MRAGHLAATPDELPTMWASPLDLTRYRVDAGDLVVAEGGDVGRPEFVPEVGAGALIQNSLHRVRPRGDTDRRFLRYALLSIYGGDWLDVFCNRSTLGHLTVEKLSSLRLPVPPAETQTSIADFLDTETARIDALITKKRRLSDQLQLRMASSIESTLQSLVAMPAVVVPTKYLVREVDERLGERDPFELLSVSIHKGVVPRASMTQDIPRAEEVSNYKVCRVGDIVINRMRAFHGGLGRAPSAGIVSPDYTVLRPGPKVDGRFLHYLFRSPWFVAEMSARLRGIGGVDQGNVRTPRVNFSDLGLIRIPVPSTADQARLADSLDVQREQVESLGDNLERQIRLVKEHRQALITAAVTGELEVPGMAA